MSNQSIATVFDNFEACNAGDLDEFKRTLAENVVHYFLPAVHRPIRGADHLARYWCKFRLLYAPIWKIDHCIASGDEVVSEWSCAYTLPSTGERMLFRGTEWYHFADHRIAEVRAYYQYDESRDCQLNGFPYAERGYLGKATGSGAD